jgi:hypothetical protein
MAFCLSLSITHGLTISPDGKAVPYREYGCTAPGSERHLTVTAIMSKVLAFPFRPVPRTDSFDAAGGRRGS